MGRASRIKKARRRRRAEASLDAGAGAAPAAKAPASRSIADPGTAGTAAAGVDSAAPDGSRLGRFRRGDGPWILALFLLVAVFYFPATKAGFVWDDSIVTTSQAVREWSGLRQLWFETGTTYHPDNTREGHFWPVVYSTFWLEHKLWGFHPLGYHLVNVLLHFANCWLIWRLLRRLAVPGAWLAAAVFAVHPVHVEAVVWVIARKDQLATLFCLVAALAWLRFAEAPRAGRYAGAMGAFVAGLLSKTMAATLPAALLVARWWKQGRASATDLLRLLPFFAVGLGVALNDMFFYQAEGVGELHVLGRRAPAHRVAGGLVLPRQAALAGRPGGHLPALGRSIRRRFRPGCGRPRRLRPRRCSGAFADASAAVPWPAPPSSS